VRISFGFVSRLSSLIVWLSASIGCVVVDDPKHCWNLDRDATCEELYAGSVCSRCARGYSGCVDPSDDIPESCLDLDEEEPSSSSAEGTSEAGAAECIEGPSDACPSQSDDRPQLDLASAGAPPR
jgi:hypothetical protein